MIRLEPWESRRVAQEEYDKERELRYVGNLEVTNYPHRSCPELWRYLAAKGSLACGAHIPATLNYLPTNLDS